VEGASQQQDGVNAEVHEQDERNTTGRRTPPEAIPRGVRHVDDVRFLSSEVSRRLPGAAWRDCYRLGIRPVSADCATRPALACERTTLARREPRVWYAAGV
jgi:hypothetical protein